jgi:hypothetical protein
MPRPQRVELAERIGTSYAYLQKLAGGFGTPSLEFAQRIKEALPKVDMEGFLRAKQGAGKRGYAQASRVA